MNEYKIIDNLPFGFDFHNRSRKELMKYSEWFYQNKEQRMFELNRAIQQFTGKMWQQDYSINSLAELNVFLLNSIKSENLSKQELEEKKKRVPTYITIQDWDLTVKSRSLLVDVGIYWGEVIIYNNNSLHWEQFFSRNKNDNDYGHMVIMLKNSQRINPIWLMYIQGLKIIKGTVSQTFLNDLYSIWTSYI